jgi:hypothetical protein
MNRDQERALLLFGVAVVLIATPVRALWLQTWWTPFAFWLSYTASTFKYVFDIDPETGGVLISPLPNATPTKPGSATFPLFGIQPLLVDQGGKVIGPIATPDQIRVTSGLPKTRSGKIMRRILRKIAAGEGDQLGDISTLADPSVVEALLKQE